MTENLRLVSSKTLTSSDSDVSANYVLSTSSTSGWCTDTDATCHNKENVLDSGNTSYGVYYSWKAATAGTGTAGMASGNATSSICPKAWRLPTGGYSGEFQGLYNAGYNTTAKMQSTDGTIGPGFVLPGRRGGGNTYNQGSDGYYWSSTASSANNANYLYLDNSNVKPVDHNNKCRGFSVRCISR